MDVFGLVGNPVGHSRSPVMHEAAYEELGLDARYVTFEPDPDDLGAAIRGGAALGVSGLNVTIPFKEAALEFVEADETADRIGALTTIDFSTEPPTGYNTDAAGARRALEHHDVELSSRTAVVLGAGGASRAISYALVEAGSDLHVANRTESRAIDLAESVGGTAHGLDEVETLLSRADLLVNATSVGMESAESPVSASALHDGLVVMDAVYTPLQTRLLKDARAAGAETIDGAWMLLFQGVEAFEIWTGRTAPIETMNAALRSTLADDASV